MFDLQKLEAIQTPFYYYDKALLCKTIETALAARPSDRFKIHYAIKANSNPEILRIIASYGLGADCVSIGEMKQAIAAGFAPDTLMLAGVGKRDDEIEFAILNDIYSLNVESHEELKVIASIAARLGRVARVALRVNPDIDAHTHSYITTGLEENKFGIDRRTVYRSVQYCMTHPQLKLVGLHFHIGSQIEVMEPYRLLCERINGMVDTMSKGGLNLEFVDVGGGLGIDYYTPDRNPIPDFKAYFETLSSNLKLGADQVCCCELGRSIVAQCGSLMSRVLYVKEGVGLRFVILDAGMNDLIRPALYGARHVIQNLTSTSTKTAVYDVVGPVCESDDCFAKGVTLPITHRGDLIAIRSAGAYGESMASCYNSRPLVQGYVL